MAMPSTSLSARDIRAVYASRRVAHGQVLTMYVREHPEDRPPRVAVVAGRRVGTAVCRNRAKRRLRAILQSEGVPAGLDIVLVAKPLAVSAPFPLLVRDYGRLRERLATAVGAPV
jgi:ribonuclease P protein component